MFLHYYGQDGARLNREQSVHYIEQEKPRPSYLFMLISCFLFYMPCVYMGKLNEVFVDQEGRPFKDVRIRHVEILGTPTLLAPNAR